MRIFPILAFEELFSSPGFGEGWRFFLDLGMGQCGKRKGRSQEVTSADCGKTGQGDRAEAATTDFEVFFDIPKGFAMFRLFPILPIA